MIPKKEHINQIERFHNLIEDIGKKIEKSGSDTDLEVYLKYFELTSKIWPMVDDCIEKIKDEFLSDFKSGNLDAWFVIY